MEGVEVVCFVLDIEVDVKDNGVDAVASTANGSSVDVASGCGSIDIDVTGFDFSNSVVEGYTVASGGMICTVFFFMCAVFVDDLSTAFGTISFADGGVFVDSWMYVSLASLDDFMLSSRSIQ